MPQVAFDAQAHRYTVDGKPVPGVSRILEAAGLKDMRHADPAAMQRGTYVHEAVSLDYEGDLDEATLHPSLAGYVEGFRRWKIEMGVEVIANEHRVFQPHLLYCGTADWIVRMQGRTWVIDLKSGAPAPWHCAQLAAYALAYQIEAGGPTPARAGLYLAEEGQYRFHPYKERSDFDLWKAAVVIGRWRIEKGLFA